MFHGGGWSLMLFWKMKVKDGEIPMIVIFILGIVLPLSYLLYIYKTSWHPYLDVLKSTLNSSYSNLNFGSQLCKLNPPYLIYPVAQTRKPHPQGSITQVLRFYLLNPSLIYLLFSISTVDTLAQISIISHLDYYNTLPYLISLHPFVPNSNPFSPLYPELSFQKMDLIMTFSYLKPFGS